LKERTAQLAATYIACGLDTKRFALYRQSDLPEACELAWILSCVAPMGLLERAVGYKEARQRSQSPHVGLFNYPILMAADILLLSADLVPVGRDQVQHIEIARDLARLFNARFGGALTLPQPRLSRSPYIPGLDGEKMSKRYGNTIDLLDSGQGLAAKVKRIETDSKKRHEPKNPDTCTVFSLLSLVVDDSERENIARRYREGTIDYVEAKDILAARLGEYLKPIQNKYHGLLQDRTSLDQVLSDGAAKARLAASETLRTVRRLVGLEPRGGR
jgi:tryptophanyl-tRNA synthetase